MDDMSDGIMETAKKKPLFFFMAKKLEGQSQGLLWFTGQLSLVRE